MSGIAKISCDDGCGCYDDLVCDREDIHAAVAGKQMTMAVMLMEFQELPEGNLANLQGGVLEGVLTDHNAGSVARDIAKSVYSNDLTTPAARTDFHKVYTFDKPKDVEETQRGGRGAAN